jgi:hypothetical protein
LKTELEAGGLMVGGGGEAIVCGGGAESKLNRSAEKDWEGGGLFVEAAG